MNQALKYYSLALDILRVTYNALPANYRYASHVVDDISAFSGIILIEP